MQNETTIMELGRDILVGTLSVHCVTCHGPNILPAAFRIWFTPLTAVFATCSLLTNERTQGSTRGYTTFGSTPRLLRTGILQCHLHNPRCCLRPFLYPSYIANNAPTRIIGGSQNRRTPNGAGRRTYQARIYIGRVPALMRVESLGTYPHYRATPTYLLLVLVI